MEIGGFSGYPEKSRVFHPMTHGPSDFGSPDPRAAVVEMPIAIPSIIVLKKTAVMFLGLGIGGIFQLATNILVAKRRQALGVSLSAVLRLLEELSFDAYINNTPCNKNPE